MPGDDNTATDTSASQWTVFDCDGTLRRLGGDTSLLADLVQLYEEDSPALLTRIASGVQGQRHEEIRHAAHSLRGLAANFGAAALSEPLLDLEEAATEGRLEVAAALLARVRQESSRLQEALASHHR